MIRQKQVTLHHYWDDDCTIELRYLPSKKMAKKFAKNNGYVNYAID